MPTFPVLAGGYSTPPVSCRASYKINEKKRNQIPLSHWIPQPRNTPVKNTSQILPQCFGLLGSQKETQFAQRQSPGTFPPAHKKIQTSPVNRSGLLFLQEKLGTTLGHIDISTRVPRVPRDGELAPEWQKELAQLKPGKKKKKNHPKTGRRHQQHLFMKPTILKYPKSSRYFKGSGTPDTVRRARVPSQPWQRFPDPEPTAWIFQAALPGLAGQQLPPPCPVNGRALPELFQEGF